MEYPYTAQLINNLSIFYKDSDIDIMHYPHIKTIRIILPANANLKNFANNLFNDLEKLPEIDFPREMVYFWMCQIGSANFYKELINPTKQAELDWRVIGTGPETWVLPKDLGKY